MSLKCWVGGSHHPMLLVSRLHSLISSYLARLIPPNLHSSHHHISPAPNPGYAPAATKTFFKNRHNFLPEGLTFFPAIDSKRSETKHSQRLRGKDTHTHRQIAITIRLRSLTACVISIIPRDYGYSTGNGLYIPSTIYNTYMEPLMSMASIE